MDSAALWAPNADDHEFRPAIDLSAAQQEIEGPEQQRNVLVASVLRHTEQEWLILPAGIGDSMAQSGSPSTQL